MPDAQELKSKSKKSGPKEIKSITLYLSAEEAIRLSLFLARLMKIDKEFNNYPTERNELKNLIKKVIDSLDSYQQKAI